jgi:hypothetical protein
MKQFNSWLGLIGSLKLIIREHRRVESELRISLLWSLIRTISNQKLIWQNSTKELKENRMKLWRKFKTTSSIFKISIIKWRELVELRWNRKLKRRILNLSLMTPWRYLNNLINWIMNRWRFSIRIEMLKKNQNNN